MDKTFFLTKILNPLGLLVIGWIMKYYYDRYFVLKPRLVLRLGKPLFSLKLIDHDIGHELTWRFESELKNNSKYDCYNVELFEIQPKCKNEAIITNRNVIKHRFPLNNHIESNKSETFTIKKMIRVEPNILISSRIENNVRIIIPGLKIKDPCDALMPNEIKEIKLVVKYENEKGKVFYTKYIMKNYVEKNEIKYLRPFPFKKLI